MNNSNAHTTRKLVTNVSRLIISWRVLLILLFLSFDLLIGLLGPIGAAELTSNADLETRLKQADQASHVTLHEIGRSVEKRPLWAVHIRPRTKSDSACVVLLVGQQHADEPAGGEALLNLVEEFASHPEAAVLGSEDLWIVPRINPDGAERPQRRNANNKDLNRDHLVVAEPETRALYNLVRQVRPHLAVDCHEFGRDSSDYRRQGWTEWPLIMMDTANLAIMPPSSYLYGIELCESAGKRMQTAGINYCRYTVGDCPCDQQASGELRHSTLDADDARNGISLYGCMSFIIESGFFRSAPDPQADLPERVAAYRELLGFLLDDSVQLTKIRDVAERMRNSQPPPAIPTNVMWANQMPIVTEVKVIVTATGQTLTIPTTTFMHERMVKSAVPTPIGYMISANHAELFAELLQVHQLPFTRLETNQKQRVEQVRLVKLEEDYDDVYQRYNGRQVTMPKPIEEINFPAGSLVVTLAELKPDDVMRASMLLEPRQLFGLYQWPSFRDTVSTESILPVARLCKPSITTSANP